MASMAAAIDASIARAWKAIASNATFAASSTTFAYVDGPSKVAVSVVRPAANASAGNATAYAVVLPGSGTA